MVWRMSRKGKLAGAVLAANDKIACGIMHAAADLKVLVPDQLRVVGFNDSQISRPGAPPSVDGVAADGRAGGCWRCGRWCVASSSPTPSRTA